MMKAALKLLFSVVLATSISTMAPASTETDQIAARVAKKTGMKVRSVTPTPFPGLYEVVLNGKILYMDKNARFAFVGHLFDTATNADLTAGRLETLSKIPWETLPLKDAIKVVYGNGKRRVAVFTDAKCSYCSVLEKNLRTANNVTVYNFVAPILNSKKIASAILCSKDPAKAWSDHMTLGVVPKQVPGKCDTSSLERNRELMQFYGFSGTPVIVFSDGSTQPGALPVDELDRRLSGR